MEPTNPDPTLPSPAPKPLGLLTEESRRLFEEARALVEQSERIAKRARQLADAQGPRSSARRGRLNKGA